MVRVNFTNLYQLKRLLTDDYDSIPDSEVMRVIPLNTLRESIKIIYCITEDRNDVTKFSDCIKPTKKVISDFFSEKYGEPNGTPYKFIAGLFVKKIFS